MKMMLLGISSLVGGFQYQTQQTVEHCELELIISVMMLYYGTFQHLVQTFIASKNSSYGNRNGFRTFSGLLRGESPPWFSVKQDF